MHPPTPSSSFHCLQPFLNLGTAAAGAKGTEWNQPQSLIMLWLPESDENNRHVANLMLGDGFNRETWRQDHFWNINISLSCPQQWKMKRGWWVVRSRRSRRNGHELWEMLDAVFWKCLTTPVQLQLLTVFARDYHCQNFIQSFIN